MLVSGSVPRNSEPGHQLEADTISFGATLSVCKKAQQWQWAMCLLKDAQRRLVPLFLGPMVLVGEGWGSWNKKDGIPSFK